MWETIGRSLGVSGDQIHNYYHNTWTKQFYDSLSPFLTELNAHIEKQAANGLLVAEICKSFCALHPQQNFCSRYLQ